MLKQLSIAWQGWIAYIDYGKYAALLLLVLLWFGYSGKKKEPVLMLYTALLTLCCICPITAAVLMKYQTAFYDYQWIWSYVPLTIVIAYGALVFLEEQWENYHKNGITALVVVFVLLSGSLGTTVFDPKEEKSEREEARGVLEALASENKENETICLWAPKKIMASARALHPDMELVYGRNMWDGALGAYFYEGYEPAVEELYLWMKNAEVFGTLDCTLGVEKPISGAQCLKTLQEEGVNRILLPPTMEQEALEAVERALSVEAQILQGYYLFTL